VTSKLVLSNLSLIPTPAVLYRDAVELHPSSLDRIPLTPRNNKGIECHREKAARSRSPGARYRSAGIFGIGGLLEPFVGPASGRRARGRSVKRHREDGSPHPPQECTEARSHGSRCVAFVEATAAACGNVHGELLT